MSIEFTCRYCSKTLRVSDQSAGKKCKCPSCSATLDIPSPDSSLDSIGTIEPHSRGSSSSEPASDVLQIGCPKCRVVLHYVSALEGTRGMCKGCGHIFTLSQKTVDSPTTDSFPFECPACHFMFEGKPGMEGKKGKCTECNEVFFIAPLKLPEPKPVAAPVQVSKPTPATPVSTSHKQQQPAPKHVAKPNPPRNVARPSNPPAPAAPTKSVWDDLSLPDANWSAPAQAPVVNPYSVSYPSASSTRTRARRSNSYDSDTLYSIAYWHRALVTSFIWSLIIGVLNGCLLVVAQLLLDPRQLDITIAAIIGVPIVILILGAIFLSIRFLIAYIFLCIRLYSGPVAALFIVGNFLGCVPFLPLILLIVVLVKAHSVLQAGGYKVGLTGVDPNSL